MRTVITKKAYYILIAFILFFCFYKNYTPKTSYENYINFDMWSENIMIADLSYYEKYYKSSLYLKSICPGDIVLNGSHRIIRPEEIYYAYIEETAYNESDYTDYTSNLCMHRYFYHLVSDIIQDNRMTILTLHVVNALLFAFTITVIITWIVNKTSYIVGGIVTIILGMFCPYFVMYGTNLYWCAWVLFLPMLGSILMIKTSEKRGKLNIKCCVVVTIITCIFKQLFYFEFLPTTMIAMMIPYIYYMIENKYSLSEIIKVFVRMIMGALFSFIIISIIKLGILYNSTESLQGAIKEYIAPIIYRLIGDTKSTSQLIADSSNIGFLRVIVIMLNKTLLSIKGIMSISALGTICIYIINIIKYALTRKNSEICFMRREVYFSWILTIAFSLLAPFSWFILAKPHTYVHNFHCSFLWYMPYGILWITFESNLICNYLKNTLESFIKKQWNKIWNRCWHFGLIACCIIMFFIIGYKGATQIRERKNYNIAKENGKEYVIDKGKIYLYNHKLYIVFDDIKQLAEPVFLHIYLYDSTEFLNRDFYFYNNNIISLKKKIAVVNLDSNELINAIHIGQYNPMTGVRQWEEHVFINQKQVDLKNISLSKLTDDNWINGVSVDGLKLLIENATEEYFKLINKKLSINGKIYTVTDVLLESELYTHIILDHSVWEQNNSSNFEIEIVN